jgi:anti-sigma factor RsiW
MNHEQIEREHVVDRYVLGRLSPTDAERFEEHYLSCPACLEQIELTERLRAVATQAAVVEASRPRAASWASFGAKKTPLLLAAALLLAALAPAYLWWRTGAARPEANALVLTLAAVRGGGAADQEVQLGEGTPSVVLSLELEGAGTARYRAVVARDGRELWRSDDLRPSAQETLVVTLPAALLAPGEYRVDIAEAAPPGRPVASFAFRIVP